MKKDGTSTRQTGRPSKPHDAHGPDSLESRTSHIHQKPDMPRQG